MVIEPETSGAPSPLCNMNSNPLNHYVCDRCNAIHKRANDPPTQCSHCGRIVCPDCTSDWDLDRCTDHATQ